MKNFTPNSATTTTTTTTTTCVTTKQSDLTDPPRSRSFLIGGFFAFDHFGTDGPMQRQTDSVGHASEKLAVCLLVRPLWSKIEKKHSQNSHPIIHCPTSEGVSERANE